MTTTRTCIVSLSLALATAAVPRPAVAAPPPDKVAETGSHLVKATVRGPLAFRLVGMRGPIEVVTHPRNEVILSVTDSDVRSVKLVPHGTDRMEAEFDGQPTLRDGRARLTLPRGSSVDLKTVSGDISVDGLGGELRVRSISGNVRARATTATEIRTVSGDISAEGVGGDLRLKSVSGQTRVSTTAAAPRVEFESVSGDLRFTGTCGARCRLGLSTLSGQLTLALDPRSSFEVRLRTSSGELRDELGMTVTRRDRRETSARFGKGEGLIEARSFSGDLITRKR
jgi:hypothetical protein